MKKHSELPWYVTGSCEDGTSVTNDGGERIASWPAPGNESMFANATLIVRAVNAHDDLVAALGIAEVTIERLNRHNSANGTLDVIRAALAKARG